MNSSAPIHFSTSGCLTYKGPLEVASVYRKNNNFRPVDVLPTWVYHRLHLSLIYRHLVCPHRSAISFLHQLSAFGCLACTGPPFINNFSPRLLYPHGSTLHDLFNYEDGGHVVLITNLNEFEHQGC